MTKEVKRYKESGQYSPNILVECPKCKKEGVVESQCPGHKSPLGHTYFCTHNGFIFKCYHCMYLQKTADLQLYKIKVSRNCPQCGSKMLVERDGFKEAPSDIEVHCDNCDFKAHYKPNVTKYIPQADAKGLPCDKVFGYPLWLQTSVKGHVLWAYNREHLQAIRQYVEADLRERQSNYLMTMVARLPTFIKTAKNRDDILKGIDRLFNK